jgi:hypothetical protein
LRQHVSSCCRSRCAFCTLAAFAQRSSTW